MQRYKLMALINCPECGHQMSDTAEKCPNCGYRINVSHSHPPKYIFAIILLVGIVILSFAIGLIMNFSLDTICYGDDDFIIGLSVFIITVIALLAGGWFFKKRNRFALTSAIVVSIVFTVGLLIMILSLGMESKGQRYLRRNGEYVGNRTENAIPNKNNATTTNSDVQLGNGVANEESAPVGTYQVTDKAGNKWLISVNEDETILIEGTDNSAYYGSWHLYKGKIETSFTSDGYIYPPLIFPNSESTDGMYLVIDLKEDYIYASNSAKSKNPRKRLPISKVK